MVHPEILEANEELHKDKEIKEFNNELILILMVIAVVDNYRCIWQRNKQLMKKF